MAIVYQHRRNDTNEVFYVGIGRTEKRAYATNRTKFWKNIVKKAGYQVEITHRDIIWEEACSIEKYLIAFYGRRDLGQGTLVNLTDGGEGIPGFRQYPEIIKRISLKNSRTIIQYNKKGDFIKEWISAIEAKRNLKIGMTRIIDSCKGIKHTAGGFIWRYKDPNKWFPPFYVDNRYTEESNKKISENKRIPIIQYALDGKFIKEWKSATDYCLENSKSQNEGGFIARCCKGKIPSAFGFVWRYKDQMKWFEPKYENRQFTPEVNKARTEHFKKAIIQYDLDGNKIREWESGASVERELGINSSSVIGCCRGRYKHVKRFIWKYKIEHN
jgi:hypothetical protein